jgi:carbonic anhydrase/acetyltransferase-like protein (isoleucine patch superfamily)
MFATIQIGRYLSVQGRVVRRMPNGQVMVRVGAKVFVGHPVAAPGTLRAA